MFGLLTADPGNINNVLGNKCGGKVRPSSYIIKSLVIAKSKRNNQTFVWDMKSDAYYIAYLS